MNTFYKNKKVLVTGGAGFIGSHLVEHLVSQGACVTVLDNLITGNLENLRTVQNLITFINGDIRDLATCIESTKDCFAVFHCAAQVSVPESFENPDLCYATNNTGTYNLLRTAAQHKVKRFVFSSSCAVYGDYHGPCSENTACNPLSPYAYSKWQGELLCQQFSKLHHLPTVVLRYFNVFGPRQNPHGQYAGVRAKFKEAFINNQPVTIYGDGTQTRDFVPVELVVQANLHLALLTDTQCTGAPINIATGTSTSLLDLYAALKLEFPSYQHPIMFAPARSGDIAHSQANPTYFKQLMAHVQE